MTYRTVGLATAVGLLLLAVLWTPVRLTDARWFVIMLDAGHGAVFALIAVLCLLAMRRDAVPVVVPYIVVLGVAAAAGAITELLQIPLRRDADWRDLGNDLLGALLGCALFAAFDRRLRLASRIGSAVSVLVPFAALAWPVIDTSRAYLRRAVAFPTVADYSDSTLMLHFVEPQSADLDHIAMPERWSVRPRERALRVRFGRGAWPGVRYFEPFPDWEGYATLALDLTNDAEAPLTVNLRVHDAHHNNEYADRFNTTIELPAGQRTVVRLALAAVREAPLDRLLDTRKVAGVQLFVAGHDAANVGRDLLISRIWLE